jgi:hypothetical protein
MTDTPPSPFASRLREWLPALATYDCFPEFSKEVRRFVYHPLGVLTLAALASLLCGLFLHSQGLVLCGGVLAVIALGFGCSPSNACHSGCFERTIRN